MVIVYILFLIIGMFALIKGADFFVAGSVSIAKRFHISGLIIGLTIVALGTSAPELAVSTSASLQGANEIAISNVMGSNLFNLLGILGICAMVRPLDISKDVITRDLPVSILITIFLLFVSCQTSVIQMILTKVTDGTFLQLDTASNAGVIQRYIGIVLTILLVVYIIILIRDAKRSNEPSDDTEAIHSFRRSTIMILGGLAVIIIGGQVVVYCAKEIARAAGMTETLIGLTVVAFGTSLPELVTSLTAIKYNQASMAIGNTVGSNIFNILLILGVASTISPIAVNMASCIDMMILIIVSIISLIFAKTSNKISRAEGAAMFLIYLADMIYAIIR